MKDTQTRLSICGKAAYRGARLLCQ